MKIKKCPLCNKYTLKPNCENCNVETKEVAYKFIKLRDVKGKGS